MEITILKNKINIEKLIISLAIPLFVGFSSSFFMDMDWYNSLNKPSFIPPNWVFPIAWTIIYILIGLSLYLIWSTKLTKNAYTIFTIQISLNFFWSVIFFDFKNIIGGFIIIDILMFVIIFNIWIFCKINEKAGLLLLPYYAWVLFATLLNFTLIILN